MSYLTNKCECIKGNFEKTSGVHKKVCNEIRIRKDKNVFDGREEFIRHVQNGYQ